MLTDRGNTLFYKMIITLFGVLKTQRLILVGFETLTYQKDYDRSPTLVGHQGSVLLLANGTRDMLDA